MTVEHQHQHRRQQPKTKKDDDSEFPVGMRVLAVDDNPTCLMVLETLLRKCQYHVTTTNQAITALKLLRGNKDKFDLVISDVDMPDMDGFKLLEHVGLEMDLPVIMLSSYGDKELVMKGITHGACDYLLKPVRIEELKLVWQHVLRRRQLAAKEQKYSGKSRAALGESDQNGKLCKKRKDQNDDEDEDADDSGQDNEDASTHKKPRVVWTVELNEKFVAAVHQLGVEKAVPKKILELMNVEKLTRENVASHLQKFRLAMRKCSTGDNQQAKMVASFSSADSTYARIGSHYGVGNISAIPASGRIPTNSAYTAFSGSALGRLNAPAGHPICGLSSSSMIQLAHPRNSIRPINCITTRHSGVTSGNQDKSILQGMPTSLELDQLQHKSGVTQIGQFSSNLDSVVYSGMTGSFDTKVNVGSASNFSFCVPSNSINHQVVQRESFIGNQSSATLASLSSEFPLDLPNVCQLNERLPTVAESSVVQENPFTNARETVSALPMHAVINPQDNSSFALAFSQERDPSTNFECQAPLISSNSEQIVNFTPKQNWGEVGLDSIDQSDLVRDSVTSVTPAYGVKDPYCQSADMKSLYADSGDVNSNGPAYFDVYSRQHDGMEPTATEQEQQHLKEQREAQGYCSFGNAGSLEDLVNMMMK